MIEETIEDISKTWKSKIDPNSIHQKMVDTIMGQEGFLAVQIKDERGWILGAYKDGYLWHLRSWGSKTKFPDLFEFHCSNSVAWNHMK